LHCESGDAQAESRTTFRDGCIQILDLASEYFSKVNPDRILRVQESHYSLRRDFRIPFRPLMMYLKEEKFVIPWLNYWKTKSLTGSRLSYFCTIAEQQLREHPDYEEAEFHILDFRPPNANSPRDLRIINSSTVSKMTDVEIEQYNNAFVTAFFGLEKELAANSKKSKRITCRLQIQIN